MSLFAGNEVFLFSRVSGKLTYKNEPAVNVTLRRIVECGGDKFEETTSTDENSYFNFSALTKNDKAILPKEFVSHQKLIAEHQNHEILIWETVKRSEEKNAELEGKALNLTCEMTDKTRFVHLMLNSIGTNCTW
ncbi:hypothetical protein SAMN04487965_2667 [Microbulbifer donghaiensis]|uniref:DUF6795 domain-containing protein n=2 Tax=Microbulbifer donghaiensis TaxID=494016 RepID=A0A1M5EE20_9GAMM|nr:hypothetical protein SAMN04487965_2667 [Microbulbifer donghaiensis]